MACPQARFSSPSVSPVVRLRPHPLRVALVGNPNVGKSVLFERLTGRYATVSNYPGTTVAVTRGRALVGAEVCEIIDTPGVTTLDGHLSEDEEVTRRVLARGEAELVVHVADARSLRRTLLLSAQLAAFELPTILVLNMADEARAHGIVIDRDALEEELGIPVVETVAVDGRGMGDLRAALASGAILKKVAGQVNGDAVVWARRVAERCRRRSGVRVARWQERFATLARNPWSGVPILLVTLYVMYLFVGVFGAQFLVGLLEETAFGAYLNPWAAAAVERSVPFAFVQDLLTGPYGLISMGLTYAIAIVLPVVATFFLIFGLLEDSGYIPRVAIFSDRMFRAMGLNGKAVLPMVLGLGCDTMATMTTRILHTRKERLIAILLLALGIPCSAQLATIMGILGGISFAALVTLFGVVMAQMFLVGFLAARIVPGERSEFILELPPIRRPRLANVATKTLLRVRWYLGEAVPLFLIGTFFLFVMDRVGALAWVTAAAEPLVTGLLGLPAATAGVFIMGFLRRDYGAAGLFVLAQNHELSGVQAVVALTVMTLFVPCVAHFLMIVKEQGLKTGLAIVGVVTPIAIFTGALLNHAFKVFGIEF
jgi:ferrous iron transport protein B